MINRLTSLPSSLSPPSLLSKCSNTRALKRHARLVEADARLPADSDAVGYGHLGRPALLPPFHHVADLCYSGMRVRECERDREYMSVCM